MKTLHKQGFNIEGPAKFAEQMVSTTFFPRMTGPMPLEKAREILEKARREDVPDRSLGPVQKKNEPGF